MKAMITGLLLALLLIGTSGCGERREAGAPGESGDGALTKVTLQLNWFPETEHGGYYHAQLAGYYRDAGLEVTILKGGPNTPVEVQTGSGRIDFGIVNADKIISTRAEGVPLVGLLAPFQVSPRCIIVHEDAGLTSLAELKNTTLVGNHTQAFIKYLQHKHGLEGVDIIPYRGGMSTFLANPTYAIQGYVTSEPLIIQRHGVRNKSFLLADEGYSPYTSVLITSETMIREKPEIVRAMVVASQKGWVSYLDDPGPANRLIQQQNPEMDDETLAYGAKQLPGLMHNETTEAHGFGWMTAERWQKLLRQLVQCGVVEDRPFDLNAAYTTEFMVPRQ